LQDGSAEMTEHTDNVKNILDVVAIFTTVGTFFEVISPVFGFIGAVVGLMRIYEMATGKEFSTLFKRKKDDAVDK
jgi:flagellar motor component MotA